MDSARDAELSDRLLRTAQAIPGVASAAGQTTVPFLSHFSAPLYVEGIDTVSRLGQFYYNAVTPDYFKTMGTRIVRGRAIEATDVAGSPRVMVVSEAMARALWPGRDPVGQRVRVGGDTVPWTTVVGVAENMREERLRSDSMFSYYLPSVQFRQRSGGLFVRVSGRGTDYKEAIRKPLQHEMPGASYVTVTPLADIVAPEMRPWNLGATMFVALGGLALVLAGVGLYSVIAYDVAQRTHELGVRLALGAHAADVLRLVVRDGVRMAAIGVASGVAIATWASRFVEPLLFDTSPRDITIYAAVSGVLLAVAIVASWVPARRAAATDPNIALRVD
jgi:predicted permease